jgi:hypothetical protein
VELHIFVKQNNTSLYRTLKNLVNMRPLKNPLFLSLRATPLKAGEQNNTVVKKRDCFFTSFLSMTTPMSLRARHGVAIPQFAGLLRRPEICGTPRNDRGKK